MNTNMTGFRWFKKTYLQCALNKNSLGIGRVNKGHAYHKKPEVLFLKNTAVYSYKCVHRMSQ